MFQCELKYDNVEQMDCQMIEEEKCETKYETIYDTKCDTIYEPKVRCLKIICKNKIWRQYIFTEGPTEGELDLN